MALSSPSNGTQTRLSAVSSASAASRSDRGAILAPLLIFLGMAVATRWAALGNPLIHQDEQFYLLVGQNMLQGYWPYVDIYDRKPFLLFALNALFALAGPHAVMVSQLVAIISVAFTALGISRLAAMLAPPHASLIAGCTYVALLPALRGIGAQAPVFYNLAMVLAALQMVQAVQTTSLPRLLRRGSLAMILVGVALQVKYSVVFEGVGFGILLLVRAVQIAPVRSRLPALAASLILCGLSPSLLVAAGFWAAGHGNAWWDANIIANLSPPRPLGEALPRLLTNTLLTAGVLIAAARGAWALRERRDAPAAVAVIWAASALAGYLAYGTWYDHYTLALLPPLATLAAPAFSAGSRWQRSVMIALVVISALVGQARSWIQLERAGDARQAAAISSLIALHRGSGCVFVYSGNPAFYRDGGTCRLTPYLFPDHLSRITAADRITIDPRAELARILSRQPRLVLVSTRRQPDADPAADALLRAALNRDYRVIARRPTGDAAVLLFERINPAHDRALRPT